MSQNYTVLFYDKIIRILISCSMKIFCTLNISKHNSNMHCKELHLNTLKTIFSIFGFFLHPQIPDFQILSKPYINGNIIYSAFRWHINLNNKKWHSRLVLCSRVTYLKNINIYFKSIKSIFWPIYLNPRKYMCQISVMALTNWMCFKYTITNFIYLSSNNLLHLCNFIWIFPQLDIFNHVYIF